MANKDSSRVTGQPAPPSPHDVGMCAADRDRPELCEACKNVLNPPKAEAAPPTPRFCLHKRTVYILDQAGSGACVESLMCEDCLKRFKEVAQAAPPSLTAPPRPLFTLLHSLWTKAVATPGYDKDQWMELERVVLATEKAQAAASLTAEELAPLLEQADKQRGMRSNPGAYLHFAELACSLPGIKVVRSEER